MKTQVSRQTSLLIIVNGQRFPACPRCARRPRRPRTGPPGSPKRWWPDCTVCHAEYMRDWRASLQPMQVTLLERELVKTIRKTRSVDVEQLIEDLLATPSGRHRVAG